MLWQRLLFGSCMIALVCGLVALDGWLAWRSLEPDAALTARLWCGLPITGLVACLVLVATYELAGMFRNRGHRPAAHWAAFVGALFVLSPWIMLQRSTAHGVSDTVWLPSGLPIETLLLVGGTLGACLVILTRRNTQAAIAHMATTVFLMAYLGLLGSFVVRIRALDPGPAGAAMAVWFILTVKFGDVGAFFVGKFFGRHKLAPWLSPAKTIEGVGGALLGSAVAALGGLAIWSRAEAWLGSPPLTTAQVFVFALVMAILGHLGDLVESAIKRDAGAKDSGRLVPAFGGILDLIDSPLLAAPVAWWLLVFWGAGR